MSRITLKLFHLALMSMLFAISGCRESQSDTPPEIIIGDSVCAECGMILSDERYASAIQTQNSRGTLSLLFDDAICRVRFEHKHPDITILRQWSKSFGDQSWFSSHDGFFVYSELTHTPMDSHTTAFGSIEEARAYSEKVEGEVLDFQQISDRLEETLKP